METPESEIARFYDLRGSEALRFTKPAQNLDDAAPHLAAPYRHARHLLAFFAAEHPGSSVLDMCCGTGIHSIHPASLGLDVTGIDLSPRSIEAARTLAASQRLDSRCRFEVANALHFLESHPDSFDLIFISGSLYYFDLETVMPRLLGSLRSGGQLVCIDTNGDNAVMNLYRRVRNRFKGHRDTRTLDNLLRHEHLKRMAGFFASSSCSYFDFLTLLGPLFRRLRPVYRVYVPFACATDAWILKRLPALRRLCFKFVFQGQKA